MTFLNTNNEEIGTQSFIRDLLEVPRFSGMYIMKMVGGLSSHVSPK